MNPDGSFNIRRKSMNPFDDVHFELIKMSWPEFFMWIGGSYIFLNMVFAALYCLVGIQHLAGIEPGGLGHNFSEAFFFSTQTLTTVGYGRISPQGIPANCIASAESLAGLLSFALISGLLYGRFSRPIAKIIFSETMVIAPYKEGQAVMFRIVNSRKSELLEVEVQLMLAINEVRENGAITRRFIELPLEIAKITFFNLTWTLVHALREESPLFGLTKQDYTDLNAEFFVSIKGVDESVEQLVHARRSYTGSEVNWNEKFASIVETLPNGIMEVDTQLVGKTIPV